MPNDEDIIRLCVEQGFDEQTMRYYEILLEDEGLNRRQKLFVLGLLGAAENEIRKLRRELDALKGRSAKDIAKTVQDFLRGYKK